MIERRSFVLGGALLAALVVDVLVRLDLGADPELPRLPPFQPLDPMRLTITHGDDRVVMERRGKEWFVTAPFEAQADRQGVKAILGVLQRGVPMDVLVQHGEFDKYGFEGGDGIRVQIEGELTSIVDFYLGADTTGDSSFVRFPGDDSVYRARVGGRARYDRVPVGWRDLRVAGLDPADVAKVTIERADGAFVFTRTVEPGENGKADLGPWSMSPTPPTFVLDQESAAQLADGLAKLRGGGLVDPPPTAPPLVTATLETAAAGDLGAATVVELGRDAEGSWARRAGEPLVYRIADAMVERATAPVAMWADRQLFAIPQAIRMSWLDQGIETVVEFDGKAWSATRPKGASVDPTEIGVLGRTVRGLRAEGVAAVSPADAGFPSKTRFTVVGEDGAVQVLEVGGVVPDRKPGTEARFVRTLSQPDRVCLASATAITRLQKFFGR